MYDCILCSLGTYSLNRTANLFCIVKLNCEFLRQTRHFSDHVTIFYLTRTSNSLYCFLLILLLSQLPFLLISARAKFVSYNVIEAAKIIRQTVDQVILQRGTYYIISDRELGNFGLKTLTQPISERNYFNGPSGLSS